MRGVTSRGEVRARAVPRTMSSVFVWFCVEVGGVSGAGAAASHLAALDPISLALLAPQVISLTTRRHCRPLTPIVPLACPYYLLLCLYIIMLV